jgi:hypothetical protein
MLADSVMDSIDERNMADLRKERQREFRREVMAIVYVNVRGREFSNRLRDNLGKIIEKMVANRCWLPSPPSCEQALNGESWPTDDCQVTELLSRMPFPAYETIYAMPMFGKAR